MAEIVMPRMSDTMEEGTVIRWLKQEGDEVRRGEPLAEIETDKATMELESYEEGTIERFLVEEGRRVPIGEPIVVIRAAGEGGAAPPAAREAPAPAEAPPSEQAPAAPAVGAPPVEAPPTEAAGVPRASPLARRIALEHGIDLRQIKGTGPTGRITEKDVQEFLRTREAAAPARPAPAAAPPAAPAEAPAPAAADLRASQLAPQSRMQATIARRMIQSKTTVPHFYVSVEVDMAAAVRLRRELNAAWAPESVSFNDLIVRASAVALRAFPQVNASYQDGQIAQHGRVNVGIAVTLEDGGLVVPVLHDADRKDLRTIASETKPLIERSRTGRPAPTDYQGGTFSVSNLGMFGVEEFLAIVNPPESSILATGSIRQRPVVRDGELAVSETMILWLSADHRVFSGAVGAQFLGEIKRLLENPLALLR